MLAHVASATATQPPRGSSPKGADARGAPHLAFLYARSGALAHDDGEAAFIWVALLVLACAVWIVGRGADRRLAAPASHSKGRVEWTLPVPL